MGSDEEYRRQAAEFRRMAENAKSPLDKDAWLRLADSWLQMLPKRSESEAEPEGWPKSTDEDSKASH